MDTQIPVGPLNMGIRMDRPSYERLRALADREERSIAFIVRRAVLRELERCEQEEAT